MCDSETKSKSMQYLKRGNMALVPATLSWYTTNDPGHHYNRPMLIAIYLGAELLFSISAQMRPPDWSEK
jgi:hypothetical protein